MPSRQELKTLTYGYETNISTKDSARQKQLTDYAKALGCRMITKTAYYNNGVYWLRSPYYDTTYPFDHYKYSQYIESDGTVNDTQVKYTNGVVPALTTQVY